MLPALLWILLAAPEGSERRIQPSSVSASSFRAGADGSPKDNDHPWFAVDDDPKTAWVEGEEGLGPGPWIELALPTLELTTRLRIQVRNGNQGAKGLFKASARAKDLKVTLLPSGVTGSFTLKDAEGWQPLVIDQPEGPLSGARIEIEDGLPGTKDTEAVQVSDLELHATSRSPQSPDLEKAQWDRIQAWRRERAAAAKLWRSSAKSGLPVLGHYPRKIIASGRAGPPSKDQRQAAQAIIALAKADQHQPSPAALEIAALALRPDFAAWRRVELALDPGVMPMVDGLCTPQLGTDACGGFEGPAVPRLAFLSSMSFELKKASDEVTIDQALGATAPKCTQPDQGEAYAFAFEERIDDAEGNGGSKLRALLLVRCGTIATRAGNEPKSALQVLVYGDDGLLSASVVPHAATAWIWEEGRTSPRLSGARRHSFAHGVEVIGD